MNFRTSLRAGLTGLALAALCAGAAFAQTAAPEAPAAAAAVPNKGDTAWMLVSSLLVLFMTLPGLALFYGGLARSKNMLSVMSQITATAILMCLIWVIYGYSLSFTSGGSLTSFVGSFSKAFLAGVNNDSTSDTFTKGVVIPEYVFICFQMTFAMITPALIIGGLVERMKFSALILFVALWGTFVYFPIAHMVWFSEGYLFTLGALDFAGGTVVHINAGIAALVGALVLGKRIGYGKELMTPHSLTMTFIGTAVLWVGWFGFNAGSNLEATGGAALAMINTFVATAAAGLGWLFIEWIVKGKPSLLGMLSGIVAGLVAVTPAAGLVGPMGAIVLGVIAGIVCFFFCTTVKNALGYDDSLDVFGVHGVGGIIGSIGTGIFVSPALGGVGVADYAMGAQVWKQFVAVVIAVLWSGIGSFILYKIVDVIVGLRVTSDQEREGLDIAEHGERAYNM
ncbi:MAG: ammonium transporter [Bosea sp. (in: a-proteobacteria)]|uniref:ammonium transporter n=1 Tax=unclassified Bosea (in: a-proteobacteria) TaxID=2653178 RepID=UPI00095C1A5C|nr:MULTISPECIES: ammonium transporter [unclassified Bosea (in: a-proteobacteria)]MBN9444075.1 ammonium transporter [Bosea sp. (in: a-proteobacteria)]MBN9459495.1 ammonium transporter [Bosea sp. (in: a-proteobacteria)]OJV11889.1 MAG: ammonia channel protein [Bosea sp. 67-29]